MKIEIKTVDKERGIVQITTTDERWYEKDGQFVPSVTWISSHYPKGIGFWKWLADKGWDESQALKNAAGNKGSKVHAAIAKLIRGEAVKIDDKFNGSDGQPEELTTAEYEAIMSFVDWFNATRPKILASEYVVWNSEYNFAGTVDLKCEIDGEVWIIDLKTSSDIWPEYELQVSAYARTDGATKRGILQIGYKRNKNKYKFTEVEDKFDLFLAARAIWQNESASQQPAQREYPTSLTLEGK